ncbi:hypothetical protein [Clostridium oceanicum]|uniref:Uncharacterized protein n=1 Tax=Clostridium oceanicum TaxID=1543 RepID=A0ABN1J9P7_9CLOT
MRKALNVLGWIMVILTTIALILTLITIYQFSYIKYFDTYYTLEWCMFFTMLVWGLKMINLSSGLKNIFYSLMCIMFAMANIFFMYMKVY